MLAEVFACGDKRRGDSRSGSGGSLGSVRAKALLSDDAVADGGARAVEVGLAVLAVVDLHLRRHVAHATLIQLSARPKRLERVAHALDRDDRGRNEEAARRAVVRRHVVLAQELVVRLAEVVPEAHMHRVLQVEVGEHAHDGAASRARITEH
eukprot:3565146-Rhodomonas_salina.2